MPYLVFERGIKVGQYEEMPEEGMTPEELLNFHVQLNEGGNKANLQVYEITEERLSELNRRGAYEFVNGELIIKDRPPQDPPVNQELADAYEAITALYEETEALKARLAVLEGGKV